MISNFKPNLEKITEEEKKSREAVAQAEVERYINFNL